MKMYVAIVVIASICISVCVAIDESQSLNKNAVSVKSLYQIVGKGLMRLIKWIQHKGGTENSFIGRCFGVARQLKIAMPIILVKLGIIVTILVFLTIFSLKSLGLLLLLVLFSTTSFASKFAWASHGGISGYPQAHPQNVHFHVHQNKDGQYSVGHASSLEEPYVWGRSSGENNSNLNLLDVNALGKDDDFSDKLIDWNKYGSDMDQYGLGTAAYESNILNNFRK